MTKLSRSQFMDEWKVALDNHERSSWDSYFASKGLISSTYDKDCLKMLRIALEYLDTPDLEEVSIRAGVTPEYLNDIFIGKVVAGPAPKKEFEEWLFNRDVAFYQAFDSAVFEWITAKELPAEQSGVWTEYLDRVVSYRSNLYERLSRAEDLLNLTSILHGEIK